MIRLLSAVWGRVLVYGALLTARRTTRRTLSSPPARVLVVCYGNIYRSAFLGAYLTQHAQGRIEVRSAGFHKKIDRPSPDRHIAMSREAGVDLSGHRSRCIDRLDVEWADIVVIMDRHNWHALWRLGTPLKTMVKKVVWAGALTNGGAEIHDPYEMTDQAAKHIVDRLSAAGDRLLARDSALR